MYILLLTIKKAVVGYYGSLVTACGLNFAQQNFLTFVFKNNEL